MSIKQMKDKYTDERIFILGNGPSLSKTDLSRLKSEHTLAMNSISKLYDNTTWRPTFYFNLTPPTHICAPQNLDTVLQNLTNQTVCFLHKSWESVAQQNTDVFYFDTWTLYSSPFHALDHDEVQTKPVEYLYEFWSDNFESIVYHYHSMYGAVQLAVWLGFNEIYFLGCDLGMEYDNPHMVFESGLDPYRFAGDEYDYITKSITNKPFQSIINAIAMKFIQSDYRNELIENILYKGRKDHFTDDYFEKLIIQDSEKHEKEIRKTHLVCKRICNHKGINIKNATIGGSLEIYDRVDLDSLL